MNELKGQSVSESKLRWGILGAGAIADAFVKGVQAGETGEVVAVGSRSLEKAKAFAEPFGISQAHGDYDALLADDGVDIIYIATPHPMHPRWAVRAAKAGKHILCEKPIALNHAQAMVMIEAARAHGVFFMEAFMYRCHPQTAKLFEMLSADVIGDIKYISATFGFAGGYDPDSRLFNNTLGGGGIMDVGCYPVSMCRMIAGAMDGKGYADPVSVDGRGELVETGVDATAAATLKFDNGLIAQVACSVQAGLDNRVVIYGSGGRIVVPNPWLANRDEAEAGLIEVHKGGKVERIEVPADRTSFSYEADVVAHAIAAGKQQVDAPAMSWGDTLGNITTAQKWRAGAGVVYADETPEGQGKMTVTQDPITRRADANMRYGRVDGIDKDISQMVMGCDNQETYTHAAALFDDWLERGGNAFDTAHLYYGGLQERLLGQWLKARGVRDEVVILSKGGHPPDCHPEAISRQLLESQERMLIDHAEIYILHRDNGDVPVGEFVDVLNEQVAAGRIGVFGGSNWSLDRVAQANAYAEKNGKQGFGVLSNNLSLAEMMTPVWDGCLHISDTVSRERIKAMGLPNFAWSSQARGYFLPEELRLRLGLDNYGVWDGPANRSRRQRAYELAEKYNVSPINIAAAYVLCQKFPSFALIGPRSIHETVTSLPALDLELTEEEITWLWDGDQ